MTVLLVKVKPNARQSALAPSEQAGEPWVAHLKAPPIDGKANEELVSLVARYFGCARGAVRIKTGAGARIKRVELDVG